MKAPAFWFQPPGLLAHILRPLGYVFLFGGLLRRLFAKPYTASIPVICVGNNIVGGSGKTPTCIALAEMLLGQGAKPVFVTRGYGGSEHGPLRVNPDYHTAARVGDEALLLVRTAPVWIGRDRVAAIRMAEKEATHIIMDDGLQNPNIDPQVKFLVIDGETGIGNGLILPAGPLRESLDNALKRVDAVILIGEHDVQNMAQQIYKPILHAKLRGELPPAVESARKVFAFAGIGRPKKFYWSCRNLGLDIAGTHNFADHHLFTESELQELEKAAAGQNATLITTEKDRVRLSPEWQQKIVALPVKLLFDIPELPRSFLIPS